MYFQVAFVRGLTTVCAISSKAIVSYLYQDSQKRYIGGRNQLKFVWIPDFHNICVGEERKKD